ncbi:hypothetical protein [Microbacterium sp. 77mftsu3.1]|uniref:hypothetical protein n=1 Tax=Microbacterium sp. 77mftsu3.1 TaxID=1761802 RepID=UPI000371BE2A|nr:hypothetical protein [Microbacterium sp. 77mftsu3.1]SDH42460.1 hypothetical protein SAMN04488590_3307 [Microbacterium sp. 77mftsu3.1]
MASPFLVLGGIAVGIITAAFGVLAVPGWVASAQDASAINELSNLRDAQAVTINETGRYASTPGQMTVAYTVADAVKLERFDVTGKSWCAVVLSPTGTFHAVRDGATTYGTGESAEDAAAAAGCADGTDGTVDGANPGIVFLPGANTRLSGLTWDPQPQTPNPETCGSVNVSGIGSTPRAWSFTIDNSAGPFYGQTHVYFKDQGQADFTHNGSVITVTGRKTEGDNPFHPIENNKFITNAQSTTIRFCGTAMKPATPLDGPEWSTATFARQGAWTSSQACKTMTVQGQANPATYPFRYGWKHTFDLTDIKTHFAAAGRTISHMSWTEPGGSDYQYNLVGTGATQGGVFDRYELTSGWMKSLLGNQTHQITACVNAY